MLWQTFIYILNALVEISRRETTKLQADQQAKNI